MADNSFKINKSVNFNPQPGAPANPVDGDFFYDSVAQSFAYYHNGSWANFDSVGTVAAATWMTGAQFTPTVVRNSVIKITGAVALTHLAGISSSFSARKITIYNAGTFTIVVEPQDLMEPTANNRIQTPTGGSMNLVAGEVATFTYDITANRWLLVSISSQAGAQVIATTSNPGLVTLHSASLFPLDGVVMSDGDRDIATGFVGLDGDKAVLLNAPLASITTLAIFAASGAASLVLNGVTGTAALMRLQRAAAFTGDSLRWLDSSSNVLGRIDATGAIQLESTVELQQNLGGGVTTKFILNNDDVQIARRKLKLSNDDGSGNTYDNYIQHNGIGSTTTRGVKFVNQTSLGTASAEFQSTDDGFSGARSDLILKASTGTDKYITNLQGNLFINFLQTGSVNVGWATAGTLTFASASNTLWTIDGFSSSTPGAISSSGTDRLIRGVANPLLVQDAATKTYVDTMSWEQNGVQNGNFAIWQRGTTGTVTQNAANWGTSRGLYRADRWFAASYIDVVASGIPVLGNNTATFSRVSTGGVAGVSEYAASVAVTGRQTGSTTDAEGQTFLCHDIDRDWVRRARGKKITISFKMRKAAGFDATNIIINVWASNGDADKNNTNLTGTTSNILSTTQAAASVSTTWNTSHWTFVSGSVVPLDATTLSLSIGRVWDGTTTFGGTNALEVTDVIALVGDYGTTTAFPEYPLAGGSSAGSMEICQRFYETSALQSGPANTAAGANPDYATSAMATPGPVPLFVFPFKTRKRKTPTGYDSTGEAQGWSCFEYDTAIWTTGRMAELRGGTALVIAAGSSLATETQLIIATNKPGAWSDYDCVLARGAWACDVDFG